MLEEILMPRAARPPTRGLIKSSELRAFLGGVAKQTLEKWLQLPDFPQPALIGRDRYWVFDEVWVWIGKQPRRKAQK